MKNLLFSSIVLVFTPIIISAQSICEQANTYINNFQFISAIQELDNCYQNEIENPNYLFKKGYCFAKLGQFEDAKSQFEKLLQIDSNHIQALNQLGVLLEKENDFKGALLVYQKLINLDSANGYYYQRKAQIFDKNGQPYSAVATFHQAISYNSRDVESITSIARILFELENYEQAINFIDQGLAIQPNNAKLLAYKMKVSYQIENYYDVLETAQHYFQQGYDSTFSLTKVIGISLFHEKHITESIQTLEKVYSAQESEIVAYFIGIGYRESGNHHKSVEYLNKAIDKGVSNNLSTYYTNLAISYEEQEMYAEAIKAYQTAYKSSKENILLYHLARNYDLYYKDKKTAVEYYEKYLLTQDSDNVSFMNYSEHRISELKQAAHFGLDTLN